MDLSLLQFAFIPCYSPCDFSLLLSADKCSSPSPVSDSDSIWVVAGRFRNSKYLSEKILFGFIFILTVKSDLSNPRAPGGIVSFRK